MPTVEEFANQAAQKQEEQPRSGSRVESWLNGEDQNRKLKLNFQAGQNRDPEQSARVFGLQMQTGLPAELIERNLDQIESASKAPEFDAAEFRRTSPIVADWLQQDPTRAAISQDDLANLSVMEATLSAQRRERGYWNNLARRFGERTTELAGQLTAFVDDAAEFVDEKAPLGAFVWHEGSVIPRYVASNELTDDVNVIKGMGEALKATDFDAQYFSTWEDVKAGFGSDDVGLPSAIGRVFSYATETGVASIPDMIGVIGSLPLYVTSRAQEIGETRAENRGREQSFVETVEAVPFALGSALLERVGAKGIVNAGRESVEQLGEAALTRALIEVGKETGKAGLREGVTEFLQEGIIEYVGENLGVRDMDAAEAIDRGIAGLVAGGVYGGVSGGGVSAARQARERMNTQARRVRQARSTADAMDTLDEAARDSTTRQRSREAFEALVAQMKGDGEIDSVYIPVDQWNTYFQSKEIDPAAIAAEVATESSYAEALSTGGDIAINLEKYASVIAGTEYHAGLVQDIRFDPSDMTLREAEEFESNLPEIMQGYLNDSRAAQQDNSQAVFDDVVGQLIGSGVERSAAETQAKQVQAVFRTLGQRTNQDPMSLYQQYNLSIGREVPEALRPYVETDMTLDPLIDRIRAGEYPTQQEIFGESLLDFVRRMGGIIDEGGELAARDANLTRQPGQFNIARDEGRTMDDMAELVAEAGFIPERDIEAMLDAIDSELRGAPVYNPSQVNPQQQELAASIAALEEEINRLGIDLERADNGTIKALIVGDLDPFVFSPSYWRPQSTNQAFFSPV